MLALSRRFGEPVRLRINGVDVWVMIVRGSQNEGDGLKLLVEAPSEVEISRDEILPFDERMACHPKAGNWRHLLLHGSQGAGAAKALEHLEKRRNRFRRES